MARVKFGRLPLLIGAAVILAACQEGAGRNSNITNGAPNLAANSTARGGDVEAPEIFQVSDTGLWDGRPSLGGIWVAHPDVVNPERAMIRNTATGKSTIGALFRRERENPGPRIQVSSDAAAALGLLAGQPMALSVVALRRNKPEPAADVAPAVVADNGSADATATAETAPDETAAPAAIAAATAAAIEGTTDGAAAAPAPVAETRSPSSFGRGSPPAPAPVIVVDGSTEIATEDAVTAGPAAAGAALAEPVAVPEDAPPTSFGKRQRRTPPVVVSTETEAAAQGVTTGDISVAPLGGAAAGAATASQPGPDSIKFPFIQAASFGTEANAKAAVDRLTSGGVAALATRTLTGNKAVWRVLAGPVGSAAEQAAVLEKVKRLGFRDAYVVRG